MNQKVSTADVARSAIDRLHGRFESLQASLEQIRQASANAQDAIRQLMSYCETAAATSEQNDCLDIADAYDDIAGKLRELLDGE